MAMNRKIILTLTCLLACLFLAAPAQAVRLASILRIKGSEAQEVVGIGLVVGLKQTGDGGKFQPSIRKLVEMMRALGDDKAVLEAALKDVKTVAIVSLSASVKAGAEAGDKVDVRVSCIGSATSLKGGRLFSTPMTLPYTIEGLPSPLIAYASGNIVLPDEQDLTNALVENGAALREGNMPTYLNENGEVSLIINAAYATLPIAKVIADTINDQEADDRPPIARHISNQTVVVKVPPNEVQTVTSFLARLQDIDIDRSLLRTEARVVFDRKTGSIVMTEDVEINPVLITHKGLTISKVTPEQEPTADRPRLKVTQAITMDPNRRGKARLADLVEAFNQFELPPNDRMEILKKLHESGQLFANLIIKD